MVKSVTQMSCKFKLILIEFKLKVVSAHNSERTVMFELQEELQPTSTKYICEPGSQHRLEHMR